MRRAAAIGLALALGLAACDSMPQRTRPAAGVVRPNPGADTAAVRTAFRAALARAGEGAMPADSPALRGYAIYPYLVAARLRTALSREPVADRQLDTRIASFLQEHAGEPVTSALGRDWLVSLAERQQWQAYLAHVNDFPGDADDPVLACYTLSARLAMTPRNAAGTGPTVTAAAASAANSSDLAAAALAVWSEPFRQPAACDGVFGWLAQQGLLTPARIEGRARSALAIGDADLGRKLAAQLPDPQAAPLLEWATLLQQPRAALEALAQTPATPVEPDALAAGFGQLALSDSAAAEAMLPALLLRPDMTPELAEQLRRATALGLAYDHAAGAAAALQGLPETARDDTVCEWGARIALWSGDWQQALTWLDQLSAATAAEPRWRYWRARALEAVAGTAVAAPLYQALAQLRDYYGYLAADRLRLPYDLRAHPTPADPTIQSALAVQPGLIRARELFECGLPGSAELEWAAALHGATRAQRIQAAQLAEDWGWYSQAIAQLGRVDDLDDVTLRYPRPYAPLVARASTRTDVPADWLLAVMRQESLFRADAVSRANALGLMQMLPTTASAVAARWDVRLEGEDGLLDPATALTLGAAHLRELLDRYNGAIALALAAYNAGTAPVARWRPAQPLDAAAWIENIPYGETRDYVEHVLENIVAFRWTRGAPQRRLSSLLPAVGPASASVTRTARAPARRG